MSRDPATEIAEADAEILAAMSRRVAATLRLRPGSTMPQRTIGGAAARELLAVVDALTRREAARSALRG